MIKVIWQKDRIAAAHGRLNRIRQVAPLYTPSSICFFGPTRVRTPNGTSVGSAVFAQLTAQGPYSLQWAAPFPSKLPIRMGALHPYLIHGSLGSPQSTTQTTSRSVQPFCRAHDRDRQTDRSRYSVCNNIMYTAYVVLQICLVVQTFLAVGTRISLEYEIKPDLSLGSGISI